MSLFLHRAARRTRNSPRIPSSRCWWWRLAGGRPGSSHQGAKVAGRMSPTPGGWPRGQSRGRGWCSFHLGVPGCCSPWCAGRRSEGLDGNVVLRYGVWSAHGASPYLPPQPPPRKPTFHVYEDGAVFHGAVIDAYVATHVVRLRWWHPDKSHAVLFCLPLQPASLLPQPPQSGWGSRCCAIVMAAQLQLPPLGNYSVWPTGADDWLAPHWNRWQVAGLIQEATCKGY